MTTLLNKSQVPPQVWDTTYTQSKVLRCFHNGKGKLFIQVVFEVFAVRCKAAFSMKAHQLFNHCMDIILSFVLCPLFMDFMNLDHCGKNP